MRVSRRETIRLRSLPKRGSQTSFPHQKVQKTCLSSTGPSGSCGELVFNSPSPFANDCTRDGSRYLIVKGMPMDTAPILSALARASSRPHLPAEPAITSSRPDPVFVPLDPNHPTMIEQVPVYIPDPHARITNLLENVKEGYREEVYDEVDERIFGRVEVIGHVPSAQRDRQI